MPFTTYTYNQILNYVIGQTQFTPATNIYIGLSKTQPNPNGTGVTEPSGGGYARKAIENSRTSWLTSTNATLNNLVQVEFADCTADWGTVTHVCFYDALTGGNLLGYGTLVSARTIQGSTSSATTVVFAQGTLVFTGA